MLDFLTKYNPLRRTKSYRRIEEMEQQITSRENEVEGLEKSIVQRSNFLIKNAEKLERTTEEVMQDFDNFRGH